MLKAVLLSSLAVNFGILLGRLAGFAREAVVASRFGATAEADVVVLMLTVPDLLINLLVGSGLTATLIPRFAQCPDQARQLWGQVNVLFTCFFALLSFVLGTQVSWLFSLFGPGLSPDLIIENQRALSAVLWLLPLTVLSGIIIAYLQADNRFVASSLGTLIINLFILLGLVLGFSSDDPLTILAAFILAGGLFRIVLLLWPAIRIRGWPTFSISPWLVGADLVIRFFQVVLAGGVLLCFPVIARSFASHLGPGELAKLSYALKLVDFPQVLAVTFLSVVLMPRLSAAFVCNRRSYAKLAVIGLQATIFLALLATVIVYFNALTFSRWVYGHGIMSETSLMQVGGALALAVFGLVLNGVSQFCMVVLNAQGRTRAIFLTTLVGLCFLVGRLSLGSILSIMDVVIHLLLAQAVVALILFFWTVRCLAWKNFLNLRWMGVFLGPSITFVGVSFWVGVADSEFAAVVGSIFIGLFSVSVAVAVIKESRSWILNRLGMGP